MIKADPIRLFVFYDLDIGRAGAIPAGAIPAGARELAGIINGYLERMNSLASLNHTLVAYVYSFVTTESYHTTTKR